MPERFTAYRDRVAFQRGAIVYCFEDGDSAAPVRELQLQSGRGEVSWALDLPTYSSALVEIPLTAPTGILRRP